jgi:opacity protein-like surface antigen
LKNFIIIVAMLALVAAVAVAPALAQRNSFEDRFGNDSEDNNFFDHFDDNDFLDSFFNNDVARIEQSVDKQSQSGDVSLGYQASNSGD